MSGTHKGSHPLATMAAMGQLGSEELLYLPACSVIPGARSFMNLPFAVIPGYRFLRLDLHLPKNTHGPVPVVVYASGGAFLFSLKQHGPWKFLPSEGFAVVSVEYRPGGEACYPAALHDVKAAVRWVRANADRYGLDRERVAGWGSSAGAYLVSMAAVTNGMPEFEGTVGDNPEQSSRLASVIDHYGPSDYCTIAEDTQVARGQNMPIGTTAFFGFEPRNDPEEAAKLSPISYISAETVPFLILHGDADTRVGIGQSRRLHDALHKAGVDVEFITISGANHVGPEFDTPDAHARALGFLRRTLDVACAP
jgi:acetyl esterase/lipase